MMSGVHMGAAVKGAAITHADAKMNAVQYYQVCMASTRQSGRLYVARELWCYHSPNDLDWRSCKSATEYHQSSTPESAIGVPHGGV